MANSRMIELVEHILHYDSNELYGAFLLEGDDPSELFSFDSSFLTCISDQEDFLRDRNNANASTDDDRSELRIQLAILAFLRKTTTRLNASLTLLHISVALTPWSQPCTDVLLNVKADPNAQDDLGQSPMFYFSNELNDGFGCRIEYYSDVENVFRTLLHFGANPCLISSEQRQTVLHLYYKHEGILQNVLESLASSRSDYKLLDCVNDSGDTALSLCIKWRDYRSANKLLDLGSDPNVGDPRMLFFFPLNLDTKHDRDDELVLGTFQKLLASYNTVDIKHPTGDTPLNRATNIVYASELLKHGADAKRLPESLKEEWFKSLQLSRDYDAFASKWKGIHNRTLLRLTDARGKSALGYVPNLEHAAKLMLDTDNLSQIPPPIIQHWKELLHGDTRFDEFCHVMSSFTSSSALQSFLSFSQAVLLVAQSGSLAKMKVLVEYKASLMIVDDNRRTLLHYLAQNVDAFEIAVHVTSVEERLDSRQKDINGDVPALTLDILRRISNEKPVSSFIMLISACLTPFSLGPILYHSLSCFLLGYTETVPMCQQKHANMEGINSNSEIKCHDITLSHAAVPDNNSASNAVVEKLRCRMWFFSFFCCSWLLLLPIFGCFFFFSLNELDRIGFTIICILVTLCFFLLNMWAWSLRSSVFNSIRDTGVNGLFRRHKRDKVVLWKKEGWHTFGNLVGLLSGAFDFYQIAALALVTEIFPEEAPTSVLFRYAFFSWEVEIGRTEYIMTEFRLVLLCVFIWLSLNNILLHGTYSNSFKYIKAIPQHNSIIKIFSHTMYLTITEKLLRWLKCSDNVLDYSVPSDNELGCWEGDHLYYATTALVTIVLFQLSVSTTGIMFLSPVTEETDIRWRASYVILERFLRFCLLIVTIFLPIYITLFVNILVFSSLSYVLLKDPYLDSIMPTVYVIYDFGRLPFPRSVHKPKQHEKCCSIHLLLYMKALCYMISTWVSFVSLVILMSIPSAYAVSAEERSTGQVTFLWIAYSLMLLGIVIISAWFYKRFQLSLTISVSTTQIIC